MKKKPSLKDYIDEKLEEKKKHLEQELPPVQEAPKYHPDNVTGNMKMLVE